MTLPAYYHYWGKAKSDKDTGETSYHLLPYHCLDVAAVAVCWLKLCPNLLDRFSAITKLDHKQTQAWILFFIALHDYGKFDLRFQRKAKQAWQTVNPGLSKVPDQLNGKEIKEYHHGFAGLFWFYQDQKARFDTDQEDDYCFEENEEWEAWYSWLASVVGHHGIVPEDSEKENSSEYQLRASDELAAAFRQSRLQWLQLLEQLFLIPAGLNLSDNPPKLETGKYQQSSATLLAGFCSVSDWLGSSDAFDYHDQPCQSLQELQNWYRNRLAIAEQALINAGLTAHIQRYQSVQRLLEKNHQPRQVQCLVDELPDNPGLTLIEAATGSGKTEAALAYAWKLLGSGLADSIVFALPTQATANAMLSRLEKAAPILFQRQTNLVLAHGRSRYQQDFINLQQACRPQTVQQKEEAWVQCGQWLAQSRKRVFFGQIGVCTVDQVLVSVLPVKHKFVRGFGVGRSVLIIDEVHAYDSYMYGLLEAVLEQQRMAGGSAVLLSATLPFQQKQQLAKVWDCTLAESQRSYPLITHCQSNKTDYFNLSPLPEQQPKKSAVGIELIKTEDLFPNQAVMKRMLDAVESGAQVCLVCNLVADAQALYQQCLDLIEQSPEINNDQCLLFHSRYLFNHRQDKEKKVLDLFGAKPNPGDARKRGHLLIATQVVEQSLDLDFDWLITQLCPVDLLFQRMGRLHRHQHNQAQRPENFQSPVCTILLPTEIDYDLHELIYGNSRVLWRTEQLLQQAVAEHGAKIKFPTSYRDWIEKVYQDGCWPQEPESVQASYQAYEDDCFSSKMLAKQLITSSMQALSDNDSNVSALTRDGEMNLTVTPVYHNAAGQNCLLDGRLLDDLDESEKPEVLNLNSVAVPKSWGNRGRLSEPDEDGVIWLSMQHQENNCFHATINEFIYHYHADSGLTRTTEIEETP